MARILLVDANNILHRSYHAMINTNLTSPSGEPVWAVHGLLMALGRNLKEYNIDRFLLAFDSREVTIRKSLHPFYKGTRKPAPENLSSQLALAHKVVSEARLGACNIPGWEADDIIASALNEDDSFFILSSDKDAHQLLNKNVTIIKPEGGLLTIENFLDKYNFQPELYRYFAALVGENSDNISGVDGIGEKTAIKILQTLATTAQLDALEDSLTLLTPVLSSKQIKLLEEGIAIYHRNLSINKLNRDLMVVKNFASTLLPEVYTPVLDSLNLRKAVTLLNSINQETLF